MVVVTEQGTTRRTENAMDLILVGGLWLDGTAWDEVVPALAEHGRRGIPVTLPGQGDGAALLASARMLGLLLPQMGAWTEAGEDAAALIEALLTARAEARKAKDFARADAIRDGFKAAGVEVKDTAAGAEWSLSPGFDAARLADQARTVRA